MSGIFGVVLKKDCREVLFYGTDYHSHLGTQFGGLAVWGESLNKKIHDISRTQFKARFYTEYQALKGNKGIGVISTQNPQPISIDSKFGLFAICTTGFIENSKDLAKDLFTQGVSLSDSIDGKVNMTELVAKLIIRENTIVEGIKRMFSLIRGSCSLLLLTKHGLWAARDKLGYSPLVVGQNRGGFAVATETSAFSNLGFQSTKILSPGEIVFINEKAITVKKKPEPIIQINGFLWIYTGFPASSYEGINVEVVRERCGRYLAGGDNVAADLVAGIPDSGTTHAIGYALESGIPFRRPLVKYTPGYDRSYTPPSQETRDLIARMKLIPIKELIQGKRIVLCDDSIVRGTQLKNYTLQKLWENGAKEVHLRIACPPYLFPSRLDYSTKGKEELAARRAIRAIEGRDIEDISEYLDHNSKKYKKMVKYIAKELGVTTLKYQTVDDMVKAIGLTREQICLYIWTGQYPCSKDVS